MVFHQSANKRKLNIINNDRRTLSIIKRKGKRGQDSDKEQVKQNKNKRQQATILIEFRPNVELEMRVKSNRIQP